MCMSELRCFKVFLNLGALNRESGVFSAWNAKPRRSRQRFFHGTPLQVEKKRRSGTLKKEKSKIRKK